MPARTKACSACRKKRIKCDGTLPHCLMCSRAGKLCPGPLQGPLIIDMTANARTGMKRRNKEKQVTLDVSHTTRMDRIGRDAMQATVIEVFYTNFLARFAVDGEGKDIQNQLTWLHHLPDQVTDRSNGALILALQATAIAYSAMMSSQTALDRHARELYSTALQTHCGLLQVSESRRDITIHAVSTSVLLSFFEAMQATTADAYRTHIYGAAKMIEVTGPGECANGVLCQLFYHVRTQMLFVQLASHRDEVPISTEKILHGTLWYQRPPLIQRIMSCIVALIDLRNSALSTKEHESVYTFWKLEVDQLWNEYDRERNKSSSRHNMPTIHTGSFSHAFEALILAYFSSANIMLAVFGPSSAGIAYMKDDLLLILNAATYIETDRNPVAFMRMATPLLLVALHGGCSPHRDSAIAKFQNWSKRSMKGISALAFDAIHKQEGAYKLRGCDNTSCL